MDSQLLLQSTYLDVIFDGRNKAYGGYELRISYPQRMKRAGLCMLIFCMLFTAYSLWVNRAKPLPVMPVIPFERPIDISNVVLDKPLVHVEPPAAPKKLELKTELYIKPEIVDDKMVEEKDKLATQESLKNAVASTITQTGTEIGDESFDLKNVKNGNGDGRTVVEGGGFSAKIETVVEQMPEFPGGEKALYEYLSNQIQYPTAALNANKEGKVLVKFVVNEDGSVTMVNAVRGFGFGSEAEGIRVVSAMPNWKPARNNGRAVKVWFQVPIFFKLN
jgi:periplasmic protein TonB